MERTIVVSRTLLIFVTAFLALVASTVAWPRLLKPPSVEVEAGPGQAAVDFVREFYTVDYRDRRGWLDRLAPLAASEGQALLEQGIAVVLWPELEKSQTVVPANQVSVEEIGLALEGKSPVSGGSAWQAWSVAVNLADGVAWPGMRHNTFTAYVMLRQEAGQWKFATFLSEPQLNELRRSAEAKP
ncbi:MAG: hypothetical protein IT318_08455 [Anaerolineales bacterium]|nr:hypothetical protein [Anaerolineales bacterium]